MIDGTVGSLFTPLEQLLAQQAALTESMEKRNLYAKIAGKCLRKSLNSGGNTFMEILAKKFEEELRKRMTDDEKRSGLKRSANTIQLASIKCWQLTAALKQQSDSFQMHEKRVIHQRDSPRSFYVGD